MGKKSKSGNSKKPAASKPEAPAQETPAQSEESTPPVDATVEVQVDAPSNSDALPADVTTMSSEAPDEPLPEDLATRTEQTDLEAENLRLKAQLEEYKMQLQSKDEELQLLKTRESEKGAAPAMPKGSNADDLDALQNRLKELKEKQQKADAQRDMAWKELRRVIEEVSTLAESHQTVAAS